MENQNFALRNVGERTIKGRLINNSISLHPYLGYVLTVV